jgi:uroporphyrinogen-III synthase
MLLPRAAGARPILPDTLRARGAIVDEVVTLRRGASARTPTSKARRARSAADAVDVDHFTSSTPPCGISPS